MPKSTGLAVFTIFAILMGTRVTATTFPTSPMDEASDDPLIIACRAGAMNGVQQLVESGLPLNSADKTGLYPLLIAAYKGNLPLLEYLLENGADVNFQPYYGPAIVVSNTEEIALFLLRHGTDLDRHLKSEGGRPVSDLLFFKAAANGWNELLAEVNSSVSGPDLRDYYRRTPLFGAAQGGHLEALRMLLKWGAQVDATDQHGLTPLMEASSAGQVSTAKELITAGANLNHQNESGMNVLTLTVFRCWNFWPHNGVRDTMPILNLLVESGAKIENETLEELQGTPCRAEYEYLTSEYELRSATSQPNTSFQRTLTPAGFGPLNSDR